MSSFELEARIHNSPTNTLSFNNVVVIHIPKFMLEAQEESNYDGTAFIRFSGFRYTSNIKLQNMTTAQYEELLQFIVANNQDGREFYIEYPNQTNRVYGTNTDLKFPVYIGKTIEAQRHKEGDEGVWTISLKVTAKNYGRTI